MKNFIYLFISLSIYSCSESNYKGYVYEFDNEIPLENVTVYDSINKIKVFTNKNGYFEIKKNDKKVKELIFIKEACIKRKIKTISIQNGELMREYFKGDTIYLKCKDQ
ncbi:hypothetical protein [Chryseobacterium sp. ERMR1:04]|uniref:hypothetical protein n=1 Tax=Chryseobacterium sp. ERMR1:04 TaxID=1705393 RepID=UPI0006C8A2DE|nr:hypothetical protein [Chryseobacterium sp. ERMR1:04]KPH13088.1 hypothetical protein AMQ68_11390 [Chryseobacterium sp. ERMR1:04]